MKTEIEIPHTLMEAIKQFADPQAAFDFMVNFRWPGGVVCPYCDCRQTDRSLLPGRHQHVWHCKDGKKLVLPLPRLATIMEDSLPLPLDRSGSPGSS